MSLTTQRINTYFAVLLVTLFGSAATLLIVRVASADIYIIVIQGQEQYQDLLR